MRACSLQQLYEKGSNPAESASLLSRATGADMAHARLQLYSISELREFTHQLAKNVLIIMHVSILTDVEGVYNN